MTDFPRYLLQIQQHLEAQQVGWCLIGGLAVGARAEPRFTKDLDLAVASASDQASEELIFALQGAGYRILAILEQQTSGRLATVRFAPPDAGDPVIIDLLFASSGVEEAIVARAEQLEVFPGIHVPVASRGDLMAMKVLARNDQTRPQDRLDLKVLLDSATPLDKLTARQALEAITRVGHNRGRDLLDEFAQVEREFGLS